MVVPLLQLVLFGEIVLAQKIMYEKFGNEFLIHFVSKGFPAAHCPQDLAEEYCQKLQVSEIVLERLNFVPVQKQSIFLQTLKCYTNKGNGYEQATCGTCKLLSLELFRTCNSKERNTN